MFKIQGDSPSIFTSIFSINNVFIQILNFGVFKYNKCQYSTTIFQILELFCTT